MGHGLGQTDTAKSNHQKSAENKRKATEIQRISVALVRPEGFEPPDFWSVACLRIHSKHFSLHLMLFIQNMSGLSYCLFN